MPWLLDQRPSSLLRGRKKIISLGLACLLISGVLVTWLHPQQAQAATISAVNSTATTAGSTGVSDGFSLSVPTGTTTGDLLIGAVAAPATGVITAIDDGSGGHSFTLLQDTNLGNSECLAIYYRFVQAGDPASYIVASNFDAAEGTMMAYRGVSPTNPFAVIGSTSTGGSSTIVFPSITTNRYSEWIVGILSAQETGNSDLGSFVSGSPTPTVRSNAGNLGTVGSRESVALWDGAVTTIGSYGSFTFNLNTANSGGATVLALQPDNLAPTTALSSPSNGAHPVPTTPALTFVATDRDSDWVRFKVFVYNTASTSGGNCSGSSFATADETSSQTGFSGQDTQSSTAYNSGTTATYTVQSAMTRGNSYCWQVQAIDPVGSGVWGSLSAPSTFTINAKPNAPSLTSPASNQQGIATLPTFWMVATDPDADYVEYWVDVCSTSNCSSIVQTICQTSSGSSVPGTCSSPSQSGWLSQSQQNATAYSSGQAAGNTYQGTALSNNTQYWWRAYAVDPGGSNTWSSASSIGTFTTIATGSLPVNIVGGTTIKGGTTIH